MTGSFTNMGAIAGGNKRDTMFAHRNVTRI